MSRGRRRCGYRDISSQHKITSLIKGAQATCNPGGRYAPCGDAPKQQGRGAPAAWVVGFLPRVGFLDDTNFANSRDTLDAACVRHARGRGARTPDGAVPAPGHWASRSQEVCADRRLDIVIEVQTRRDTFIFHRSHAPGALTSPPATESGVLQSVYSRRCITPYAPIMFSSFIVTHLLSTYLLRPMVRASVTHHGSGASSLTARAAMRCACSRPQPRQRPCLTGGALAMPRLRGTGQLSGGSGRGSGTSWHRRRS